MHLARGNHESKSMNSTYGFEGEVKAKYPSPSPSVSPPSLFSSVLRSASSLTSLLLPSPFVHSSTSFPSLPPLPSSHTPFRQVDVSKIFWKYNGVIFCHILSPSSGTCVEQTGTHFPPTNLLPPFLLTAFKNIISLFIIISTHFLFNCWLLTIYSTTWFLLNGLFIYLTIFQLTFYNWFYSYTLIT